MNTPNVLLNIYCHIKTISLNQDILGIYVWPNLQNHLAHEPHSKFFKTARGDLVGFHTLLTSRWLEDFWHKVIFKSLLSPLCCLHCSDLCSSLRLVLMPPLLPSSVLFAFSLSVLHCILLIWEIKIEDMILISISFLLFLELSLLMLFLHCFKAFLTLSFTASTYISVLSWTEQYWACSPPDFNTICCFCDTFITSHFIFSSLSLCRPSPPSVYPYPLCPFLMLSFSFYSLPHYSSFPSAALSGLTFVWSPIVSTTPTSRDWNHHRQLAVVSFAPKARGNGEKCVGCAWCDETAGVSECPSHQMPTCSLNFFPTFWLLSLDLHHHCRGFVWLRKGNEVFIWSEIFCLLFLWAWKTSERPSKCIFV